MNKNGVNRSWGILNCRQAWLWGAGMCHKLTPGQYVLLTLIINVIFLRRKKLSSWWKTQMSIYMADQPCIDMHKCSFRWGREGEGENMLLYHPFQWAWVIVLTCLGLDSVSRVLEENKAGGKIEFIGINSNKGVNILIAKVRLYFSLKSLWWTGGLFVCFFLLSLPCP